MMLERDGGRLVVSSQLLSVEELRSTIDTICQNRSGARWSLWCFDGRWRPPNELDEVLVYLPRRLAPLACFRLCQDGGVVCHVKVNLDCRYEPAMLGTLLEFLRDFPHDQVSVVGISCRVVTRSDADTSAGKFLLTVTGRTTRRLPNFLVGLGHVYGLKDLDQRRRFFESAISLGLPNDVEITCSHDGFELRSTSSIELKQQGLKNGRNPYGFHVESIKSFAEAWPRAAGILTSPLIDHISTVGVGVVTDPAGYVKFHEILNNLATGWEVQIDGGYDPDIDPYSTDASRSLDGRFPILTWMAEEAPEYLYFGADIVPMPDGRVLEIHSNCGNIEMLLGEAESASGISFAPVQ